MKRLWVILGALAVFCALSVTSASAAKLDRQDIGWNNEYRTSTGGSDFFKSKTQITAAGTVVDTTAAFTLLGKALPFSKPDGSNVDSTMIATLVFSTDSSGTATNDLSKIAITFQGSEDGVNWETLVSYISYTMTSGVKSWTIPIWYRSGDGVGAVGVENNPFLRRQVRALITATTGNQYSVRCHLWYWTE